MASAGTFNADSKAFARTKGTSSPSTSRRPTHGVMHFTEHEQPSFV